jgi:hypothetical protein
LIVLGLAPFILAFVYTTRIAQRFARLVPVKDSDAVEFPIETFQEQLALDALENTAEPERREKAPWKCPACGELNPGSFDECWKCSSDEPTVA